MVVPVIAGAAVLSFVAFGKELFGEKTFNQIFKGLIVLGVIIISYIGYKMYKTYSETKEKVDDAAEYVSEKFDWVFNTGGKEQAEDIYKFTTEKPIEIVKESWELELSKTIAERTAPVIVEKGKDLYNAPTYYILKGKENIMSLFNR